MSRIEDIRTAIGQADRNRARAKELDSLSRILSETYSAQVGTTNGRWWWRTNNGRQTEIVLTDEERREFARLCTERAGKLHTEADQIETNLAMLTQERRER